MITVKSLRWNNWFSYGEDNYINFLQGPLVQISGVNGSGKSSIPLILEEVFFGKNHIGKKKQTLVNRYLDKPVLFAEVKFLKDKDEYTIKLTRKSTVKIQFFKGTTDLSSHTATNTYKTIQEVLGIEFKVFVQLIYQSTKINLEFLEATDTNRKKFLISLFNLLRYVNIHDVFKKAESGINTELAVLRGKVATIDAWINKYLKEDLTDESISVLPIVSNDQINKLATYKSKLLDVKGTNSKINKNNQYKELLKKVDMDAIAYAGVLPAGKAESLKQKRENQHKITENTTIIRTNKASIDKISKLGDKCPSCYQDITSDMKDTLVESRNNTIVGLESSSIDIQKEILTISKKLEDYASIEKRIDLRTKTSEEFANLHTLIDTELSDKVIVETDILKDMKDLELVIKGINNNISEISKRNSKVEAKNSKNKVIKEQLEEYKTQSETISTKLKLLEEEQGILSILKKTFSPNGLLSYKLDYLIKDLEIEINFYLNELSSGKFQINFVLEDEKLNINILDEGMVVSIEELSAGELARVNTATLLAIRKLMSAISSTRLNILFLDEITGVLDDEGKEKLLEVLHNEKDLNTFLVAHEYSHALIPKITIVKEGKISRIDYDM